MNKNDIICFLQIFKNSGYEFVKADNEKIYFKTILGGDLFTANNDTKYATPNPHKWELIEDEIERLENEVDL